MTSNTYVQFYSASSLASFHVGFRRYCYKGKPILRGQLNKHNDER